MESWNPPKGVFRTFAVSLFLGCFSFAGSQGCSSSVRSSALSFQSLESVFHGMCFNSVAVSSHQFGVSLCPTLLSEWQGSWQQGKQRGVGGRWWKAGLGIWLWVFTEVDSIQLSDHNSIINTAQPSWVTLLLPKNCCVKVAAFLLVLPDGLLSILTTYSHPKRKIYCLNRGT